MSLWNIQKDKKQYENWTIFGYSKMSSTYAENLKEQCAVSTTRKLDNHVINKEIKIQTHVKYYDILSVYL